MRTAKFITRVLVYGALLYVTAYVAANLHDEKLHARPHNMLPWAGKVQVF